MRWRGTPHAHVTYAQSDGAGILRMKIAINSEKKPRPPKNGISNRHPETAATIQLWYAIGLFMLKPLDVCFLQSHARFSCRFKKA
jgi:hypothetical protein